MCFHLYLGSTKPLPRKRWSQAAPGISVTDLSEHESAAKSHFSRPEVQYIGSTSKCGCDFPHLMFQNGGWPGAWEEDKDPDENALHRNNQEALVAILRASGEDTVELYGVWSTDFSEPKSREDISITDLLRPDFYFKEQGFYTVKL